MIIFFVGVGGVIIGFAGYLFPNVRNVETIMPDHAKAAADDAEELGEAEEPAPLDDLAEALEDGPEG
ncbi:MAG: hypothetical protein GWN39_08680 [Thermoplasmata archaeon]|nr:hypothetical protein [Thermoplasmata archaeon]NIS20054.1 hypothetical protein [Thermoplasmata archaeon]NIT77255.1 hypothetical protein [Thermoplasmata archaeon]NIU49156.1 hypothetical protein [Thermoplasmata archaeon]NIV78814.1 hypothetical protein [Thermoplasmata archaeon]